MIATTGARAWPEATSQRKDTASLLRLWTSWRFERFRIIPADTCTNNRDQKITKNLPALLQIQMKTKAEVTRALIFDAKIMKGRMIANAKLRQSASIRQEQTRLERKERRGEELKNKIRHSKLNAGATSRSS